MSSGFRRRVSRAAPSGSPSQSGRPSRAMTGLAPVIESGVYRVVVAQAGGGRVPVTRTPELVGDVQQNGSANRLVGSQSIVV